MKTISVDLDKMMEKMDTNEENVTGHNSLIDMIRLKEQILKSEKKLRDKEKKLNRMKAF